jgi:polysaccharide deacetylase family protein (PEP-CTERM system associated)
MTCLTFDIEERFHSHLTPANTPRQWHLRDRIAQLIDWLDEHQKKATFFVVGELAEQYPDLIRRMTQINCEVASHSYSHLRMDREIAEMCKEDISRSKKVLEDIIGDSIYGYRSPSWSARLADDWLWDHLTALGIRYDASLFPFKTHMYGSFRNPPAPFWIRDGLFEIPPSVYMIGPLRIPYGGGFYFRCYPFSLTRKLIQSDVSAGKIPILYFHPWEFEPADECYEISLLNKFIGNYNVERTWKNFTSLLENLETVTMVEKFVKLEKF